MDNTLWKHLMAFALQHRLSIQSYPSSHPLRRYYNMCIKKLSHLDPDRYRDLYLSFVTQRDLGQLEAQAENKPERKTEKKVG